MKKMALLSAAVLSAAASLSASNAYADQAASIAVATWFLNVVHDHNGKQFCPSAATTIGQLADAVETYAKKHPDLDDEITDAVAIQALAQTYPCTAGRVAANSSHGQATN
ncbi:Rap1a/Tai family immunity protein [Dyella humicola]|uniref:Rap1a/Tai family immunity protein n=1 Tax=Dyella humicola TaxID=2992126 RepID=UPI00224DAF5B|nr:Rap1a/Tai family immunity protein [Dyella humicola]